MRPKVKVLLIKVSKSASEMSISGRPQNYQKSEGAQFFRIFQEKYVIKGENEILMESNDIIFG